MRKTFVGVAAAAFLSVAGICPTAAAEHDPPSPARNFDAYYYRSPGGIGRPARPSVYNADRVSTRDCGPNRRWVEGRCIDR
jgi:hypothetical protein